MLILRTAVLLLLAGLGTARAQDLLPVAFSCGKAGPTQVRKGRDLWRIDVDPAFPDALCNDETRAVFYVRRWADDRFRNHWNFHLEGGGTCTTGDSCALRWCSVGTNFGADKMSTRGAPPGIRAKGIFDRAGRNRFRGWNHVYVYYCSSDSWSGEASNVAVVAENPATGASQAYRIHFRGATIVDAVRDQLRRDCAGAACPCTAYSYGPDANGDGCPDFEMPDLDEADLVLLTGSSAGSGGVRVHADAFGESLRAHNTRCAGCPEYRAVVDAGFAPETDAKNYDTACTAAGWCDAAACVPSVPPGTGTCDYGDYMSGFDAVTHQTLWHSRSEDTCEAWHADPAHDPLGETWRCKDPGHLGRHHVSTPLFVRTDLADELLAGNYHEAGFGTCQDFGLEVEAQHRALFGAPGPLDASADEGSVVTPGNPVLAVPGVFAPQHTDHVGLTDRVAFFRVRLPDPGAPMNVYSFHDTLWNWLQGAAPQQLVTTYTLPGIPSPWCP